MHSWLSLLIVDKLMVRATSARGRKEGTQGTVAILKKSPRLCISRLRYNEFVFCGKLKNWDWTLRRHLKFSGCTWYKFNSGREKGNLEALSKKVNLMSEILARPGRRNTWGNLMTSRLFQQCRVEFGEKICKLKPNMKLRFILLWRRQRHSSAYVYCEFGSFNAQCWARRIELRYNGYFEKVQNTMSDLPRPGAVQINE